MNKTTRVSIEEVEGLTFQPLCEAVEIIPELQDQFDLHGDKLNSKHLKVAFAKQDNFTTCLLLAPLGRLFVGNAKRAPKYDRFKVSRGQEISFARAVIKANAFRAKKIRKPLAKDILDTVDYTHTKAAG